MGNEKVEVLGMTFDKGKEPQILFLQRNKDGIFYGPNVGMAEYDLRTLIPYLEGGEIYIDFENVLVLVFLKTPIFKMWIGKDVCITEGE